MALTVVCLVDRRRNTLARGLRKAGIIVIETFTTDQAVAVCVSNHIDAIVLDQEFFIEVDGWSVAQSIKLVRPSACVLLATRARVLAERPPKGVDTVLPSDNIPAIIKRVKTLALAS
ncbi:MAG: hypothetical protein ACRD3Q_17135 [Terriglobales bacterium]